MTTDAKWSDFASMDGARTIAAANSLLPRWVSLVLVVVIAWQVAKIVWMLVPGPGAGDPVIAPANMQATQSQTGASADVQSIVSAHIFGEADADDEAVIAPVVDDSANYSDTRLTNLSLKGTITSTPSELGVAIISDGNNEEKVYSIDEQVTSGASLHAVYADRVVLNENGVLTNGQPTMTRRTSALASRATTNTQSIQAVVAQNVSKLADVIRPTPYFVNGQQQGYRVYPGRDRQAFSKLGLRPGDLVKDIDGQALTDPNQAMQIFESLNNAEQVSVTVERNGQPQVIVLSTSQLDLGDETSQ
jgi:general secretion pathway protein C